MLVYMNLNYCINEKNIGIELERLELLPWFNEIPDSLKIEYILSRADDEILDWHYYYYALKKNSKKITFKDWKRNILTNFVDLNFSRVDVYRLSQKANQTITEFIQEVIRKSKHFNIPKKDIREIIISGCNKNLHDLRLFLIRNTKLDLEFIKRAQIIEDENIIINKKLKLLKNLVSQVSISKREIDFNDIKKAVFDTNRIFSIDYISFDAIKCSSLKDNFNKCKIKGQEYEFKCNFDANCNFISKDVVKKLGLRTHGNSRVLWFYVESQEKIRVFEHTIVDLNYKNVYYKVKFYVLHEITVDKILLGRRDFEEICF